MRVEIDPIGCAFCRKVCNTEWEYDDKGACRGMRSSANHQLWGDAIVCSPCADTAALEMVASAKQEIALAEAELLEIEQVLAKGKRNADDK